MRLPIHEFGIFDGECSSMCVQPVAVPALQGGNGKYGSTVTSPVNYLRWVHSELERTSPPRFDLWLGKALCKVIGVRYRAASDGVSPAVVHLALAASRM